MNNDKKKSKTDQRKKYTCILNNFFFWLTLLCQKNRKNKVIEYTAIQDRAYKLRDKYNSISWLRVVVNDNRYSKSQRQKDESPNKRYFPYTRWIYFLYSSNTRESIPNITIIYRSINNDILHIRN